MIYTYMYNEFGLENPVVRLSYCTTGSMLYLMGDTQL